MKQQQSSPGAAKNLNNYCLTFSLSKEKGKELQGVQLVFPKKREKYYSKCNDHTVECGYQYKHITQSPLQDVLKSDDRCLVQQQQLGYDQWEAQYCHQGGALLRPCCNGGQESEYQAQADPAQAAEQQE